jgi:hypothetical protein
MTTTAPDPQQGTAQDRIAATVTSIQTDLARTDAKASLLLALSGAALVALSSTAPSLHPAPPAATAAALAAAALLASTLILLLAIRPHLGGSGWTSWARLSTEELHDRLTSGYQVEHLKFMAALAVRKFRLIRIAVDCMLAGLGLLALMTALLIAAP